MLLLSKHTADNLIKWIETSYDDVDENSKIECDFTPVWHVTAHPKQQWLSCKETNEISIQMLDETTRTPPPQLNIINKRRTKFRRLQADQFQLEAERKSMQGDKPRSFFCHFISLNRSFVPSKKSVTLLPWSSRSVDRNTFIFDSFVRYSHSWGTGKTICSIVLSCRTIWT